jgi:hypothetical protein
MEMWKSSGLGQGAAGRDSAYTTTQALVLFLAQDCQAGAARIFSLKKGERYEAV